ncbi:MAG: hypothetical protein AB8A36_02530 [Prochlorococcus sp.]
MSNASRKNSRGETSFTKSLWLSIFLLGILLVTGCKHRSGALLIYVGIPNYAEKDLNQAGFRKARKAEELLMANANRRLKGQYPGASIAISYYPNRDLLGMVRRRSGLGLGPDLIIASATVTEELYAEGLIKPFRIKEGHSKSPMNELQSIYLNSSGDRIGLPILIDSQLGCGNRKLIKQIPSTFNEWLNLRVPIGFDAAERDQIWIYGVFGAAEPIMRAVAANPHAFSDQDVHALEKYLNTLRSEFPKRDLFSSHSHNRLLLGLEKGELAWTTCRTSDIPRLRESLAEDLLVSPLPKGEQGVPLSIPIIRTATIGTHSTDRQKLLAKAWLGYWLRPIEQRTIREKHLRPLDTQDRESVKGADRKAIKAIVNAFQASPLPRAVVPAILGPRTKGNNLLLKIFDLYWNEKIEVQELVDNIVSRFALRQ